jgi:hypothetical protein
LSTKLVNEIIWITPLKKKTNKKGPPFGSPYYLRRIRLLGLRLLTAGSAATRRYLRLKLFDEQFVHYNSPPAYVMHSFTPSNNLRGPPSCPKKPGPYFRKTRKQTPNTLFHLKVWGKSNKMSSIFLQITGNMNSKSGILLHIVSRNRPPQLVEIEF